VTAPPSSTVDFAVAEIRSVLGGARQLVIDIINGINSVLDQLPPDSVAGIRAAAADLQRLVDKQVAEVERQLAFAGSPDALRSAGESWREVGRLASAQAGKATLNSTQADDRWTGDAADAYGRTLPAQEKALVAIKARTDEIDKVLQDLAGSINSFWADIGFAAVALGAALASALILAVTTVGAPAAAGLAAAAVGAFAAAANSALTALVEITNACAARTAEFERTLANDDAFEGGIWPKSTTAFSDASLTDGDDTDWHIG
jgi:hypothetical protein